MAKAFVEKSIGGVSVVVGVAKRELVTQEQIEKRQVYTFVQDVMRLASTGIKMDRVIESIKAHPVDFVMWRDANTKHNLLMTFVDHGHHKVVRTLLDEAAKISADAKEDLLNGKDKYGRNSLDFARTKGMRTFMLNLGATQSFASKKLIRKSDDLVPGEPEVHVQRILNMSTDVKQHLSNFPDCPR